MGGAIIAAVTFRFRMTVNTRSSMGTVFPVLYSSVQGFLPGLTPSLMLPRPSTWINSIRSTSLPTASSKSVCTTVKFMRQVAPALRKIGSTWISDITAHPGSQHCMLVVLERTAPGASASARKFAFILARSSAISVAFKPAAARAPSSSSAALSPSSARDSSESDPVPLLPLPAPSLPSTAAPPAAPSKPFASSAAVPSKCAKRTPLRPASWPTPLRPAA
mmetsp:Transcript_79028/g.189825  ORF Transcript_79028/g.189825 Transcript_79028/m.189825 type:complete len:220 (+) Transcript_79028:232-891(+)